MLLRQRRPCLFAGFQTTQSVGFLDRTSRSTRRPGEQRAVPPPGGGENDPGGIRTRAPRRQKTEVDLFADLWAGATCEIVILDA